jgi:hypothetical protein
MKTKYIFMLIGLPMFGLAQTRDNAGATGNEGAVSGFFETVNPVNYPAGATNWWHLLDVRHANGNNNYAMQFAGSFYDQNLYFRKTDNWAARPWLRVVTEDNGTVNLTGLNVSSPGINSNVGNSAGITGNFVIQANTGGRFSDKGAQLEFVVPANTDGTNLYGQGRIITVAGNSASYNAAGKMILGTRRMFDKLGTGQEWYYGDDIVIDGVGNIGIGTLTPREKLSVNGNIRAREMKVESTNWPDYVFREDYQLPSLREVEKYIKANNHLPEIPSAAEIEKEGVHLGEMNKLLMKKIEELTLHLIEKENQLETQGKTLLKIEERLKKLESNPVQK